MFFQSHLEWCNATGHNQLGCSKLHAIHSLLKWCEVNVVCSNADNLFLNSNPFGPDTNLGRKLLSPCDAITFIHNVPVVSEQTKFVSAMPFSMSKDWLR